MFEKSASARHKNEHRVVVTLAGAPPLEAYVFLKVGERLIDLLNDQRMFIPIKRADGATMIASKQNIVSIIEKPEDTAASAMLEAEAPLDAKAAPTEPDAAASAEAEAAAGEQKPEEPKEDASKPADDERTSKRARRRFDPYEILRIAKDAGPEEIRKAYHARMKAVHPDAIAALDLDEDLARAANISAQRVNRAYRILMRDRHDAPKAEESAA